MSLAELLHISGPLFSVSSPDNDTPHGSAPSTRPPHLSQVRASGKLWTQRKVRPRNWSSLAAEWMLDEELHSFSAWLRLPRLLQGDASAGWLGKTTCFKFSCSEGLEEPSARGWGGRGERGLSAHDHQRTDAERTQGLHPGEAGAG